VAVDSSDTWKISSSDDCWGNCNDQGGKCDFCGNNGYCCSPTKLDLNGDCPADIVQSLKNKFSGSIHQCIYRKFLFKNCYSIYLATGCPGLKCFNLTT